MMPAVTFLQTASSWQRSSLAVRGFPDEGILAVYSLAPHNLGEMLYTKRFGKAWEAQRP